MLPNTRHPDSVRHGARMSFVLRLLPLVLALACADMVAAAGPSRASEDNDPAAVRAEPPNRRPAVEMEVVEVAGKRESSLNDGYTSATYTPLGLPMTLRETPQSVSVITETQIRDQNIGSLADALSVAPGVSRLQRGALGTGYTTMYARGNEVDNYLLDGVPSSINAFSGVSTQGWGSSSMASYERIEVLKGGAALLGGSGNPGAQISLVRKRPTSEGHQSYSLSAGRWNRRAFEADVSGSLNAAQSLRGRAVVSHSAGDGWQDRARQNRQDVYAILEADVARGTTLTAGAEYQRDHARGTGVQSFMVYDSEGHRTPFGSRSNHAADWSKVKSERYNVFVGLKHRLNADWTSRIEYNHTRTDWAQQLGVVGGAFIAHDTGLANAVTSRSQIEPRQHALTATLNGRYTLWGRKHDALFGFNGYRYHSNAPEYDRIYTEEAANAFTFAGDLPQPVWEETLLGRSDERIRQYGFYAATRLYPTDALAVILGGRWNQYRYRYMSAEPGTLPEETDDSRFTPYAGVVHDLNDQVSAYASYSQTFKPQTYRSASGAVLEPEEGSNAEIGLKGEFLDGRLNASVTVFQTRKDNLAVETGISDEGFYVYEAADNTKTRGVEIEAGGEIREGWSLQGGYTRARTRDAQGALLNTFVPRQQFTLYSNYRLPGGLNRWSVGAHLAWQSETFDPSNTGALTNPDDAAAVARAEAQSRQQAYTVLDLSVGYRFNRQVSLGLHLNNALDETYRTAPDSHTYGEPRNLMAVLRYQPR